MFSRLKSVWEHSQQQEGDNHNPVAAQMLVVLGPLGTRAVVSGSATKALVGGDDAQSFYQTLRKYVNDNKQAVAALVKDEHCSLNEQLVREELQGAASSSSSSSAPAIVAQRLCSDAELHAGVPQLLVAQFGRATPIATLASAGANLEMLALCAAALDIPASRLLAILGVCGSNNKTAAAVIAMVRHSIALLMDRSRNQQLLAAFGQAEMAELAPAAIRLIVQVLQQLLLLRNATTAAEPQHQQQKLAREVDDFLYSFAAPLLSQFGFEFLWTFCSENMTRNSSSSNSAFFSDAVKALVHYCQALSYGERLSLVLPKSLRTALLLPDPDYSADAMGSGRWGAPAKWWESAFAELDAALRCTPAIDPDAVLSILRRYRFAVKVVVSTYNTGSAGGDDDALQQQAVSEGASWLSFYRSALLLVSPTTTAADSLPQHVHQLRQMVGAVGGGAGAAASSAAASFDPMMVACYYFSSKPSCSFEGRRELLKRLFGLHDGRGTALSSDAPQAPLAGSEPLLGPFWTIAATVALDTVVGIHDEENDDGPLQAELFEVATTVAVLDRLEALAARGLLSPVRLEPLIGGLPPSAGAWTADTLSLPKRGVGTGAAVFRRAIGGYASVRRTFRRLLRVAGAQEREALLSLLTVVATWIGAELRAVLGGGGEGGAPEQQQQRSEDDFQEAAALATVACCIAEVWCEVAAASTGNNDAVGVAVDMIERCVQQCSGSATAAGKVVSALKETATLMTRQE